MIYSHNLAWVVHSAPDIRYRIYSGASFYSLREELSPPIESNAVSRKMQLLLSSCDETQRSLPHE